ncbi:aromatic prenyltransferase [Aspergillus varians]
MTTAVATQTPTPTPTPTPTVAWNRLWQWLPPRDADTDYWWKLTGLHLAKMLEAAGYSADEQLNALLFYYHWIVPYLGPAPGPNSRAQWKSLLGVEGSPIEYSWKWNTPTSKPDIRYTMEAIGAFAGTPLDPLNQQATIEMLHRIASAVASVDLTWTNHFLATLFDHDRAKYVKEAGAGVHFATTIVVAAEWLPRGLSLKTYFVPRRLGQTDGMLPMKQWEESISQLIPHCPSRAAMHDFLATSPEGSVLKPYMLAVDNIIPEKSRMKFYFQTPHTSFASVREIMTLGGRIAVPEAQLQALRDLLIAVSGLPADFPDAQEVPCPEQYNPSAVDNFVELPILLSGYLYYFDIAPGPAAPGIKLYTPVRRYGPDDRALADGIMQWMESHGRGEYCQQYSGMLEDLTQHRKLADGKGMQTYVSCLFKSSGELDITSYIGPEAFDASRA